MTDPLITRTAQCGTVAFFNAAGQKPFVPLMSGAIAFDAPGQLFLVGGQFTLSGRPDASQNYPGFEHVYTAGGFLFLTAQDPTQLTEIQLSSGTMLDPASVRDGWWGGGTDASPMNPYINHLRLTPLVSPAAGAYWVVLVGYASSGYAQPGDYLLHEQMESQLFALPLGRTGQQPLPPPYPPDPPSPPSPPPEPPPPSPQPSGLCRAAAIARRLIRR